MWGNIVVRSQGSVHSNMSPPFNLLMLLCSALCVPEAQREKLAGGVTNPAWYFYTVCKGDYDQCEPKFVRREAGQAKEVCMISAKVQKGKEPEWVKYRKTK